MSLLRTILRPRHRTAPPHRNDHKPRLHACYHLRLRFFNCSRRLQYPALEAGRSMSALSQLVCPACLQFQPGTETGTGSPYFCKGPSATAPSDSSLSPSPITSFLHHSYFYPASSPSSTTLGFPSRLFIEFPQARGGASFTVVLSRTNSLHRRQVVSGTSVPNSCHQAGLHSGSRFTSALSQRGQSGVSHRDPRSCTRSPSPLPISKGKQNRAQLF